MKVNSENMTLISVGDCNWDIYSDSNGNNWAVAKTDSGAEDSWFGDKNHLLKVMRQNEFYGRDTLSGFNFTEKGLEQLSGLTSVLLDKGHFLAFR